MRGAYIVLWLLWIDYMYALSIDVKRGAGSVVDKDELSDDDVLW